MLRPVRLDGVAYTYQRSTYMHLLIKSTVRRYTSLSIVVLSKHAHVYTSTQLKKMNRLSSGVKMTGNWNLERVGTSKKKCPIFEFFNSSATTTTSYQVNPSAAWEKSSIFPQ